MSAYWWRMWSIEVNTVEIPCRDVRVDPDRCWEQAARQKLARLPDASGTLEGYMEPSAELDRLLGPYAGK